MMWVYAFAAACLIGLILVIIAAFVLMAHATRDGGFDPD